MTGRAGSRCTRLLLRVGAEPWTWRLRVQVAVHVATCRWCARLMLRDGA